MTKKFEIYKCQICGNIVQVLFEGAGELVCCGENMTHLKPRYEETELGEKHIPEIVTEHEGCDTGMCREVKYVTLEHHPMSEEHYIQVIEAYPKDKSCLHIKYLSPEDKPKFNIEYIDGEVDALELCNLHGLWRSKND